MTGSLWQVASQVLTLFLLMGVGFAMTKRRLLNEEGRRQMTTLVMDIVTPCVIINAFTSNFESGLPGKLLIGFAAAILAHVIGIAVSVLLFHRQTPEDRGVLRFSVIYSNCGYMGLPLINAVLGSGALIYGAAYIAVFNAFLWTHGLLSMSKGKGQRLSLVKVFVNPGTIGIAAALPLALFSVPIPHVLGQGIGFLADLNVPLAMIIIGSNMACSKLTDAVRDLRAITASAARLLLVPLALFAALYFVPIPSIIKAAILISTCSPVAASCTLMASRCGVNTSLADKCVTLSTLLSIVTMPLVQFVVRNA